MWTRPAWCPASSKSCFAKAALARRISSAMAASRAGSIAATQPRSAIHAEIRQSADTACRGAPVNDSASGCTRIEALSSKMSRCCCGLLVFWVALLSVAETAAALPVFARRYETSCLTCHVMPPKLNAFGIAFRNNGYRIPINEEKFVKMPDVALGAPAWKKLWPKAVWPGAIPGAPPLAIRVDTDVDVQPSAVTHVNFDFPNGITGYFAGAAGDSFSYFGDVFLLGATSQVFLDVHSASSGSLPTRPDRKRRQNAGDERARLLRRTQAQGRGAGSAPDFCYRRSDEFRHPAVHRKHRLFLARKTIRCRSPDAHDRGSSRRRPRAHPFAPLISSPSAFPRCDRSRESDRDASAFRASIPAAYPPHRKAWCHRWGPQLPAHLDLRPGPPRVAR